MKSHIVRRIKRIVVMENDVANGQGRAASVASSKRSSSSQCSVADAAARARATAEAARARATFALKEMELKKQRARLDLEKATLEASLQALELERAGAAANAEAEVLEAAAAGKEPEDIQSLRSSVTPQEKHRWTEAYDEQQAAQVGASSPAPPQSAPQPCQMKESPPTTQRGSISNPVDPNDAQAMYSATQRSVYLPADQPPQLPSSYSHAPYEDRQQQSYSSHHRPSHRLHPPRNYTYNPHVTQGADMMDFARYLARRELVTTGLTKFDDRPESFRAWQSSFFNAIYGLGLTASEELDLLIKWLGKESSEHVKRMRAVYITDSQTALKLSWSRLQECYVAPEIIESSLFKRLDSFPHLTSKESVKLRELGDLLMEVLSAKADEYLPGLNYLDTP